jgi:hypothetical protein
MTSWLSIATPTAHVAASPPAVSEPAPIPAPPCDAAVLIALVSAASLFRARFGYSLAEQGAIPVLAAAITSFNSVTASLPPISPVTLGVLSAWGSLARGVGAVRDQMGIDLLRPNSGQAFAAATAATQTAAPAPWQEDRARAVMSWLALDQAAAALGMPTAGHGALAKLGCSLRALAEADLPTCQNPKGTAAFVSAADDLYSIRRSLGVDLLSPGGADRLQATGKRLRDNLGDLPVAPAALPSAASGLTHSALVRFTGIDRTQAGDLGLDRLRPDGGPLITSAPLVLAAIAAVSDPASK